MIFSIAGPKTIQEYNNLKQSKQEINIKNTSKQMDEYVYDKKGGIKNLGIIGFLTISDILTYDMIKNDKMMKNAPNFLKIIFGGTIAFLNLFAGKVIYDSEKIKQAKLNNHQEKLKLYCAQGLNAVV